MTFLSGNIRESCLQTIKLFVNVFFYKHVIHMFYMVPSPLAPSLQLLHRWESAGCMKVVVKAPDEEALYVQTQTRLHCVYSLIPYKQ